MIVQYKSMSNHLIDFITAHDGDDLKRPLDYIALTQSEYNDLVDEVGVGVLDSLYDASRVLGYFMGVRIVGIKYHSESKKNAL